MTTVSKRTMHQPAAFIGQHIDPTSWEIPEGYALCAMTGKFHKFADLSVTVVVLDVFGKEFCKANHLYVEDADWLSEEGYDQIIDTLDKLGKLDEYWSWFDQACSAQPVAAAPGAVQPAELVEVEIIEAGVSVIAHGRNGIDYRGVVLATNPEAGEALVRVWDREVGTPYTAWWKAEWLDVIGATACAAAIAAVQAA